MKMCRGFRIAAVALAWFIACAGAIDPAAAQMSLAEVGKASKKTGPLLFGSIEFSSPNLNALPQWNRVLRKMQADRTRMEASQTWQNMLAKARGLSKRAQLDAVNVYFNKWPYKLDFDLYGVSEFWATPLEFMSRSGDCEDYAIAKFFALRELGFRNEEMRVVALYDRIRGIGHAILAVYWGADILVLDNLSNYVLSHEEYSHYDPQYSVNSTTRWAYVKASKPWPGVKPPAALSTVVAPPVVRPMSARPPAKSLAERRPEPAEQAEDGK
jgi:predicted transglutaminase-like cysteine proteinase